ncbi:MAG: DUF933 domain-containing protein [Anaerolineae bacterium]
MRLGITGLPNSGKTTVFNALTGGDAPTPVYSSGAFQANTAVLPLPDERLERLSAMVRPKKTTAARVEWADLAGFGGEQGVSLGGELVNALGSNDALLHVVRCFEDDRVLHPLESIDPGRDIAWLDSELLLSDLSKIENRLERLAESLKRGKVLPTYESDQQEFELLSRLRPEVEGETPLRDLALTGAEEKLLRGFQFLSAKPMLILLNLGDEGEAPAINYPHRQSAVTHIRGRLEADIRQLDEADAALFMEEYGLSELSLTRLAQHGYDILHRMIFFTANENEVRAWEARRGATALECAETIHSDLARGFIRAEVVHYDDLIAAGSMAAAKAAGKVRLEGKDSAVRDGDVVLIRFNV